MKKKTVEQRRLDHLEPIAYSPRQFCHVAGISPTLLYQLWRDGKGPPSIRLRERRVIPRKAAEEWLLSKQEQG
jgi:hypothetical protein